MFTMNHQAPTLEISSQSPQYQVGEDNMIESAVDCRVVLIQKKKEESFSSAAAPLSLTSQNQGPSRASLAAAPSLSPSIPLEGYASVCKKEEIQESMDLQPPPSPSPSQHKQQNIENMEKVKKPGKRSIASLLAKNHRKIDEIISQATTNQSSKYTHRTIYISKKKKKCLQSYIGRGRSRSWSSNSSSSSSSSSVGSIRSLASGMKRRRQGKVIPPPSTRRVQSTTKCSKEVERVQENNDSRHQNRDDRDVPQPEIDSSCPEENTHTITCNKELLVKEHLEGKHEGQKETSSISMTRSSFVQSNLETKDTMNVCTADRDRHSSERNDEVLKKSTSEVQKVPNLPASSTQSTTLNIASQRGNSIESFEESLKDSLAKKHDSKSSNLDDISDDRKQNECIEIIDDESDINEYMTPKESTHNKTSSSDNNINNQKGSMTDSIKMHPQKGHRDDVIEINDDSTLESHESDDIVVVGVSNPTKSKLSEKLKRQMERREQKILNAKIRQDESFLRGSKKNQGKANKRKRSSNAPLIYNVDDISDGDPGKKKRSSSVSSSDTPDYDAAPCTKKTKRSIFAEKHYNYKMDSKKAVEEQDRLFREAAQRVRKREEEQKKRGERNHNHAYANSCKGVTSNSMGGNEGYMTNEIVQDVSKLPNHHWKSKNLWCRLGLPTNTSYDFVKKNYRKLSLLYHPDKSKYKDAGDRFQAIKEAYETLSEKLCM